MLKLLIFILALNSCGTDDSSGTSPAASLSPSSSPQAISSPAEVKATSTASVNPTASISPQASAKPIASATPTPTPAPQTIGASLIASQPFETSAWAFDFRGLTLSTIGHGVINPRMNVYRKVNGVTLTCSFAVSVYVIGDGSSSFSSLWIYFEQLSGASDRNCADTFGQTTASVDFVVKDRCLGYSQQTFVCGTAGIPYDLLQTP